MAGYCLFLCRVRDFWTLQVGQVGLWAVVSKESQSFITGGQAEEQWGNSRGESWKDFSNNPRGEEAKHGKPGTGQEGGFWSLKEGYNKGKCQNYSEGNGRMNVDLIGKHESKTIWHLLQVVSSSSSTSWLGLMSCTCRRAPTFHALHWEKV